jgi:hypothetical protein
VAEVDGVPAAVRGRILLSDYPIMVSLRVLKELVKYRIETLLWRSGGLKRR